MKKRMVALMLSMTMSMGLGACSNTDTDNKKPGTQQTDGKILISTLYNLELPEFEALVESTYDDIDFDVEHSALSTYDSDTLRRLKNGHGKDLIFTVRPNGEVNNHMLDLSAKSFSTKFDSATMTLIQDDGKTIFLPMPGMYRGIILNKTMVHALGKDLPINQQEFIELLDTAMEQGVGVTADGYPLANEDKDGIPVGEMILGTLIPDFLGQMDGERWLTAFLSKEDTALGTLEEHLDYFISLSENGYMDPLCFKVRPMLINATHCIAEMADRNLLAAYSSSSILSQIREQNTEDEFVMIPFLGEEGVAPWITSTPSAYLGINADIRDDEVKLDAALRVMELFASVEGQTAILKDTQSNRSYLSEEIPSIGNMVTGLESYVDAGYVYNMNRFNSDLLWNFGANIADVCCGDMTLEEALAAIDTFNQTGVSETSSDRTLVGSVGADLIYENYNTRKEETALGNLMADAVAELAGTDIGFVNGGGIRASLYAGDIFTSDLAAVCPYGNTIVSLEVTGETIYEMLTNSISGVNYSGIPAGRFLQVSGLHYTIAVDKSAQVTEEIPAYTQLLSVTLPDGTEIDKTATYTIAVNNYMCGSFGYINGGDGYTMLNVFDPETPTPEGVTLMEDTGKTYGDAIIAYFQNHTDAEINSELERRIIVQEVT